MNANKTKECPNFSFYYRELLRKAALKRNLQSAEITDFSATEYYDCVCYVTLTRMQDMKSRNQRCKTLLLYEGYYIFDDFVYSVIMILQKLTTFETGFVTSSFKMKFLKGRYTNYLFRWLYES